MNLKFCVPALHSAILKREVWLQQKEVRDPASIAAGPRDMYGGPHGFVGDTTTDSYSDEGEEGDEGR